MTDQTLATVTNPYLDIALAGQMNDAPTIPESKTPSIPKLALVQRTSENYVEHPTNPARPGDWVIDYGDGVTPFKIFSELNVWLLGIYPARTHFARNEDGSRTSTKTPPACGSADGVRPYDNKVGERIYDFRDGSTITIGASCEGCRFADWHTVRDGNGKPILDAKGKKKQVQLCTPTPRYALWVEEIGFVALFKPTSSNVRKYMEGRKRPAIAGIDTYFAPKGIVDLANGVRLETSLTKPDGVTPHFLTMRKQRIETDETTVYVPELSVNPNPMPFASYSLMKEHKEAWDKYRQDALDRAEQYEGDEEEYTPQTPLSQEEVQAAAAALGTGTKNKKRKMAQDEEDVEIYE